jgi:hypothetical protein
VARTIRKIVVADDLLKVKLPPGVPHAPPPGFAIVEQPFKLFWWRKKQEETTIEYVLVSKRPERQSAWRRKRKDPSAASERR